MNKKFAPVMLSLSLLIISSCGKDGGGGGSSAAPVGPMLQEQVSEGSYRAIIRPYNNSLSGYLPTGVAEIQVVGDEVKVKTLMDDNAIKSSHMQSIQLGTRCPTLADDKNGDGLIDVQESYAATGGVFIPLDNDLNSADEGAGVYPFGRGYTYTKTASLSKLEADAKARTNQNLNLGGRVILIHGVSGSTQLPATVAAADGMTAQASIPVACGVIQRQ